MSRHEAAFVYLDVLLGFRGDYSKYSEASNILSANEKELLRCSISRCPEGEEQEDIFLTFN